MTTGLCRNLRNQTYTHIAVNINNCLIWHINLYDAGRPTQGLYFGMFWLFSAYHVLYLARENRDFYVFNVCARLLKINVHENDVSSLYIIVFPTDSVVGIGENGTVANLYVIISKKIRIQGNSPRKKASKDKHTNDLKLSPFHTHTGLGIH